MGCTQSTETRDTTTDLKKSSGSSRSSAKLSSTPVTVGRSERAQSSKKAPQDAQRPSQAPVQKDLAHQLKISLHRQNSGPKPDLDNDGKLQRHEVEKRRTISKQVQSYQLYRANCTLEYAYCTQRGYYPNQPNKLNQDQFSIHHNFAGIEGDSFFAVYDGHGPVGDHL